MVGEESFFLNAEDAEITQKSQKKQLKFGFLFADFAFLLRLLRSTA
jgi:hypothetical protein